MRMEKSNQINAAHPYTFSHENSVGDEKCRMLSSLVTDNFVFETTPRLLGIVQLMTGAERVSAFGETHVYIIDDDGK